MDAYRVLVIGGYGLFGGRLVSLLARQPGLHLIVCGRSEASARDLVGHLSPGARAQLSAHAADIQHPTFARALAALGPDVVVHAGGPFQGQDYRVAAACIEAHAHYIDLADGREFVAGVGSLDAAARRAGLLVTSGASSVPALSGAAADALVAGLSRVRSIDIAISPGNRSDRGLATVRAVLSCCGKPLPPFTGEAAIGWRGAHRHRFPDPVGHRLLSPCDVPDLVLLGPRYAGHPAVRFDAGLELAILHRGLNLLALLAQAGLVRNWADHAKALHRVAGWFRHWGSDAGAMHVTATGEDMAGRAVTRRWNLVATHGDGPFVPALAGAALVRRLAAGEAAAAGAGPCVGLLTLQDFAAAAQGLHITMTVEP